MRTKIKYKPDKSFTVAEDGFFGEFYRAKEDQFPGKCMIVVGGSAGLFLLNQRMAEKFVDAGMSVMPLQYHGEEGLPKDLKDQPIDVVEKAAFWLKQQGFEKIGIWGISMGGAFALLAGIYMPEMISCVVAVSPQEMPTQAELKNDSGLLEGSCFSWHGKPVPYADYVPSDSKEWIRKYHSDSWKHKELWSRDILEDTYRLNNNPDAVMKIWEIHGSLLFLGARNDSMCPAEDTIRRFEKQLKEHNYSYSVESHIYTHIGHYLLPVEPWTRKLFRVERKDPDGCAADRAESWKDTVQFLRDKW